MEAEDRIEQTAEPALKSTRLRWRPRFRIGTLLALVVMCASVFALYTRVSDLDGSFDYHFGAVVALAMLLSGLAVGLRRNVSSTSTMIQTALASALVVGAAEATKAAWQVAPYLCLVIFTITVLLPLTIQRCITGLDGHNSTPSCRRIAGAGAFLYNVGFTLVCCAALVTANEVLVSGFSTPQATPYYGPIPIMSSIPPPPDMSLLVAPPDESLTPTNGPTKPASDGTTGPLP